MQLSKPSIVSRFAIVTLVAAAGSAVAADAPMSKEVKNMVDFQCHSVTTLKQAEANYANMARAYTDAHPVMECLKKKIEELKAAGK